MQTAVMSDEIAENWNARSYAFIIPGYKVLMRAPRIQVISKHIKYTLEENVTY